MKFDFKNINVRVYGDTSFRGDCPKEDFEQISFFNWLRREHPDWSLIAHHPENEAMRKGKDFVRLAKQKAMGLTAGVVDIIISGSPAFLCELKRVDSSLSKWQKGQQESLEMASSKGAFACVALGALAAREAFEDYLKENYA